MARRPKKPKDLSTIFNATTGTLAHIQSKTNSLKLLYNIVRQICPDLPEDAFNITNFVQATLIIEVKSPAWGQRLQFERNTICKELNKQTNGEFAYIEIKVNPQGYRQIPSQQTYKKEPVQYNNSVDNNNHTSNLSGSLQNMSKRTASNLMEVASKAPKGLKEKLENIANNVNNKQ